jgi:hypothetical protein
MSRCVVNIAIGGRNQQKYITGQERLQNQLRQSGDVHWRRFYTNGYPIGCPIHQDVPYAFKAYALKEATMQGYTTLLWCDSSIVLGSRPLEELWEKIERDGYWISRNGWTNYEWTAESAYLDLFYEWRDIEVLRRTNRTIPHVIATAFGLSTRRENGARFLDEYFRLASKTKAFCGPITNSNFPGAQYTGNMTKCAPCGPMDVRGHRHDQTAASVIAWRLGMKLSDPPEWFAYRGQETEKTCLIADGAY